MVVLPVSKCCFEKILTVYTHTQNCIQFIYTPIYIVLYTINILFLFFSLKLPIFELLYTIRRHTAQAIGHLSLAAFPYHSLIVLSLLFARFCCVCLGVVIVKYKNGRKIKTYLLFSKLRASGGRQRWMMFVLFYYNLQVNWFRSRPYGMAVLVRLLATTTTIRILLLLLLCFCLGGTARVAAKWNVERRMRRAFRVFVTVERSVVNNLELFLLSHSDLTSFFFFFKW